VDRPLIVDGGLATALEARGLVLHPRLWSAGVFLERPEAVEKLHRDYLAAGADILITASYQMSFEGLAREGLEHASAADAMRRTVAVARSAASVAGRSPIVAASVGPYGATLADGSEYRGAYGLGRRELAAFHKERLEVLTASGADMLAIETIPSADEALALRDLLDERDGIDAWISFSCRDGSRIRDGAAVSRLAEMLDPCRRVTAVGVNCTAPEHVSDLIDAIREGTRKRIIVYPNSGERWDPAGRRWSGEADPEGFLDSATEWARKGVWAIGGCCRVGPEMIRELARRLRG
jgi:homocysteine S-methyltransferase